MSVLATPSEFDSADRPRPKRWTLTQMERFLALGADFGSVELLGGTIYEKMPQNDLHWYALSSARRAVTTVLGIERTEVRMPLKFSEADAPEPDVSVLSRRTSRPGPGDVELVVEISDTSLAFDLGEKAATYARHGVLEYWVVDLNRREVVVHRGPVGEGWTSVERVGESAALVPLAAPDATIPAASLMRTEPDGTS